MSEEAERRALAAYRDALAGKRTRRSRGATLLAAGSVLAVIAAVGVGAMFFTGGDRKSLADPSGARDAFLCEKALYDRWRTEQDAADAAKEAGKPLPPLPEFKPLYFCSPSVTEIARVRGGHEERQTLLANAVYAVDVDGLTTVRGFEAEGLRFGWDDKVCKRLAAPVAAGVLLKGVPIDPASC